jgi:hypothetical protein
MSEHRHVSLLTHVPFYNKEAERLASVRRCDAGSMWRRQIGEETARDCSTTNRLPERWYHLRSSDQIFENWSGLTQEWHISHQWVTELINSMEQSPQETVAHIVRTFHTLQSPWDNYGIHKRPSHDRILSQMNPAHILVFIFYITYQRLGFPSGIWAPCFPIVRDFVHFTHHICATAVTHASVTFLVYTTITVAKITRHWLGLSLNNWEECGRKQWWCNCRFYGAVCLEG